VGLQVSKFRDKIPTTIVGKTIEFETPCFIKEEKKLSRE
jgi:hypothetical protein